METEWNGHRVSIFSSSGEKLRSFGTHGSGQGQFISPCGVAVDVSGVVYVCDHVALVSLMHFSLYVYTLL